MNGNIKIYNEKLNNYNEIRVILFHKDPIEGIDTTIFPYPNINFEHPKLIKPYLKEKNILKRLDKTLIKEDIFHVSWALAKIGIATFVNVTPSSDYVDYAFMTLPNSLSLTQVNAINRLASILKEYPMVECSKLLNDKSIYPIEDITDGKTLLNYINKSKEKTLIKKQG